MLLKKMEKRTVLACLVRQKICRLRYKYKLQTDQIQNADLVQMQTADQIQNADLVQMQTADQIQNADCKLQTECKMQTADQIIRIIYGI